MHVKWKNNYIYVFPNPGTDDGISFIPCFQCQRMGGGWLGFGKGCSEVGHGSLEKGPCFIQNSRFLV